MENPMIDVLKKRFLANMSRHPELKWEDVEARLKENEEVLEVLRRMEETGGEPDVISMEAGAQIIFCDCSAETPAGRRSLCYDEEALKKRVKNPPKGSAMQQAAEIGVKMMDETMYYRLQALGEFDLKTSSWIAAPDEIRKRGGALFCERRYGRVFTFHNGADSYYSVRGWRGYILI